MRAIQQTHFSSSKQVVFASLVVKSESDLLVVVTGPVEFGECRKDLGETVTRWNSLQLQLTIDPIVTI